MHRFIAQITVSSNQSGSTHDQPNLKKIKENLEIDYKVR